MTRTFTLGRYTCVERLGTGPIGEIWRAKRFGLVGVERQFLLTKLHPQLGKDAAAMGRLQAALKTYDELEVEGLLRFREQAAQGSDAYVVLDFPGFADLRKLRAGFELSVDAARAAALWPVVVLCIGRSVAMTLAQAHERGLWHGFLSPSSVWIDQLGRVMISDLGHAQLLPPQAWGSDPNLKLLQSYLPKGVQGGAAPGPATDIFSLGVMLGELLGGSATAPETKATVEPLRALIDRARSERLSSMRELAAALDGVPATQAQLDGVREALSRVGQQFQFSGDSVPQPVTISERSSAEPLPPPPGGKTGDSKPGGAPGSARYRVSSLGDKPVSDKPSKPLAAARPASQPPKAAAKPVETSAVVSGEDDTPLPASRPLLLTNPKIAAAPSDEAGRKAGEGQAAPVTGEKSSGPTDAKRPRSSKDDIKPQRQRSGIDWLNSSSDRVDTVQAAATLAPDKDGPSSPGAAGRKPTPQANPRVTSTPPKRRSNPVSINPRGRSSHAAGSATTPTAEVDVAEASSELDATAAAAGADQAKSASLRGAAAALASGAAAPAKDAEPDHLGETNPQLAPVKPFSAAKATGDEPTNPVSLEAVALAATATEPKSGETSSASQPKRRSGPISGPSQRVLSNTAPAEIVTPEAAAQGPAIDVLGSTGLAQDLPISLPSEEAPSLEKKKPRPVLLIGGALALLIGIGIIYLLVASSSTGGHGGKGAAEHADAGADAGAVAAQPPPVAADTLVLSSTPPATVIIDGAEKGKTPATLKIGDGKHKLVLIAEEHQLLRRDVNGGSRLDVKLERAKLPEDVVGDSELKIKCKTEGKLRILVDAHDTGRTCPTEDLSLAPGKYVFGFLDPLTDELKEKKVKVKKGKKPAKVKVKF